MPQAKKNKSKGTGRVSARSTGSTRSTGSAPARSASATPAQTIPPGLTSAKASAQAIPPGLTSAGQGAPGLLPGANAASGLLLGTVDHTTLVPSVARVPAQAPVAPAGTRDNQAPETPDSAQSGGQAADGPDDLPQWAVFSAIAIVAGVIGGKGWYVAVHRGRKFDGWCIQGFVAGAAVVVAAAALAGPGLPAGAFLAAAAPALLIGMSIGRPGCFWAGCCTGRPTAARWGIWSSDRKLGCRRAPAQLLEALAALVSGVAVLAVVLTAGLARSGPAAVVGLACYTLGRQFILGLRAEPRVWPTGRVVTGVIAALALIAGVILLVRT